MSELRVIRAGTVPYEDAWAWQRQLHQERVAGTGPDTMLLLEHPPVYTAGKRTEAHERPADGTPVVDVDRGGKITWHGPGQLVGYPIVALPDHVKVVDYVRRLRDADVPVTSTVYPGAFHGFDLVAPWAPVSRQARAFLLGGFRHAVATLRAPQPAGD